VLHYYNYFVLFFSFLFDLPNDVILLSFFFLFLCFLFSLFVLFLAIFFCCGLGKAIETHRQIEVLFENEREKEKKKNH